MILSSFLFWTLTFVSVKGNEELASHLLKTKPILPFNGRIARKRKKRTTSTKRVPEIVEKSEEGDIQLPVCHEVPSLTQSPHHMPNSPPLLATMLSSFP